MGEKEREREREKWSALFGELTISILYPFLWTYSEAVATICRLSVQLFRLCTIMQICLAES